MALFEQGAIRITETRLEYGSSVYPFDLIEDAVFYKEGFEFGAFLINSAILFISIIGIFSFEGLWVGAGLIGALICGFNVHNILYGRQSHIAISLHSGKDIDISSKDESYLKEAFIALQTGRGVL